MSLSQGRPEQVRDPTGSTSGGPIQWLVQKFQGAGIEVIAIAIGDLEERGFMRR